MEEGQRKIRRVPIVIVILSTITMAGALYNITGSFAVISDPSSIKVLRESIISTLDSTSLAEDSLNSSIQSNQAIIESIKEDIEAQYVEVKYKRLNIFLLIGNFAVLFGGIFIRILRRVGFHLYLGGKLVILTGIFSLMGFSYAGWFMAGVHLIFGLIFGIVYYRYLKIMR